MSDVNLRKAIEKVQRDHAGSCCLTTQAIGDALKEILSEVEKLDNADEERHNRVMNELGDEAPI